MVQLLVVTCPSDASPFLQALQRRVTVLAMRGKGRRGANPTLESTSIALVWFVYLWAESHVVSRVCSKAGLLLSRAVGQDVH